MKHTNVSATIVAIIVAIALIAGAGVGIWWFTARDVRPDAIPASEAAKAALTRPATAKDPDDESVSFTYRSAPEFMNLRDRNGNTNYSPASLWLALAIAAQGADGRTREQMEETLGLEGMDDEDYRSLRLSINGDYGEDVRSDMRTANSLWVDDDQVTPDESFLDTVKGPFDAQVRTVDFSDADTARTISDWIAEQTGDTLRPRITIVPNEVMAIINTVYADGRWSSPFDESATDDATFHGADDDSTVPFMHQTFDSLDLIQDDAAGWRRADIPFDNGGMLKVLLPDEGRFETLAADPAMLQHAFETDARDADGATASVDMTLPRFTIENTFDSEDSIRILESLGMTDAFDAGSADFGRLGTAADGGALYLGTVVQGTRIEVSEVGAKAAAYTEAGMTTAGAPADVVEFTVDRPFLYALTTPDGVPLFIGAVRNIAA
ncbi:serine proteinase inhibitor [Bifidobacterium lemurum]|uniref:Serine proteinase inhibitor n=1 Tax=Bifidobacterium lemurum TaxID=1603886 RepID=A0A261FMY4_9BIFI|nr:serpin family protein [Bifidobacterium lemurum]OZG60514.1 serine proteinase inhibitor [Bifidobacterium lemurum]